jgi:alpha-tubulin suppressor-like RCC1 family protein
VSYERGDTVRDGNQIKSFNGTIWEVVGNGQTDAQEEGAIATPGLQHQVTGIHDQILHATAAGEPEWQFTDGRNSTAVRKLAKTGFDRTNSSGSSRYNMGAIMTDGSVRTWGDGQYNNLGDGSTVNRTLPTLVPFPAGTPPIVELRMGNYTNYAIDAAGQLWVWGYNSSTQANAGLGSGLGHIPIPTKLNGYGDLAEDDYVVDVWQVTTEQSIGGFYCSMCRTMDGRVFAWGYNAYGMLGTGTGNVYEYTPTIVPISLEVPIVDVYLYSTSEASYGLGAASYLIGSNGELYVAGRSNYTATLGDNTQTQTHKLWGQSLVDPVKKVFISLQMGWPQNSTAYKQGVMCILSQSGNIYTGSQYWVTNAYANSTVVFGPTGATNAWVWDSRISDVADVAVFGGSYAGIAVVKNDGTVWAVGNVYDVNPANNTDTNYYLTDWTQLTTWGSDNAKISAVCYNTAWNHTVRRDYFLQTTSGQLKGIGSSGYQVIGSGSPQAQGRETAFNLPIEDWQIAGYALPATAYILSGGVVYSSGSVAALGNEDDTHDRMAFSPVIF